MTWNSIKIENKNSLVRIKSTRSIVEKEQLMDFQIFVAF